MSSWTGEEVFEGLEKWLKTRRDEAANAALDVTQGVIDDLLDEVRDKADAGWMPWQGDE